MKKYFKYLVALIGICVIAGTAEARSGLGLRLSYDLTIPGDIKSPIGNFDTSSGSGVQFGVTYTYSIVAGLYVEPGVMFYYDTYRSDEITLGDESSTFMPATIKPKVSKTGLRVPVMVGYQIGIDGPVSRLYLYTGPEFSIGFKAKMKYDFPEDNDLKYENNLYGSDAFYPYRRFTTSWAIGAAVDISAFNVGLTATIGMSDQIKTKNSSMKENSLRLTVGYNF